jgi:hypothetical protein
LAYANQQMAPQKATFACYLRRLVAWSGRARKSRVMQAQAKGEQMASKRSSSENNTSKKKSNAEVTLRTRLFPQVGNNNRFYFQQEGKFLEGFHLISFA